MNDKWESIEFFVNKLDTMRSKSPSIVWEIEFSPWESPIKEWEQNVKNLEL